MSDMPIDESVIGNDDLAEELKDKLTDLAQFYSDHCDDDFVAVIPVNGIQRVLITVSDITYLEAEDEMKC